MSFFITCPVCGRRDAYEFRYGNPEAGPPPDQAGLDRGEYDRAMHNHHLPAGPVKEWWCHALGCGVWFTTTRHTVTGREMAEGAS
jgi:sarcosine oxidase subunit delta